MYGMQNPLLVYAAGIYTAVYGNMYMSFTENKDEAKQAGLELTGRNTDPYWWTQTIVITPENVQEIASLVEQLAQFIGLDRARTFITGNENILHLSGFVF